jgi:hypothetical protein
LASTSTCIPTPSVDTTTVLVDQNKGSPSVTTKIANEDETTKDQQPLLLTQKKDGENEAKEEHQVLIDLPTSASLVIFGKMHKLKTHAYMQYFCIKSGLPHHVDLCMLIGA